MASKFAGLPGFAHGEPDVYETTGTGQSGDKPPDVIYDVSENENIERLRINAGEAYTQFKGKRVSGKSADFSDSVAKMKNATTTGYDSVMEFEADGEGLADETLQERYERLQAEIRSLEADFQFLATQQQREDTFLPDNATDFSGKIDGLKSQLAAFKFPEENSRLRSSGKMKDGRSLEHNHETPDDFDLELARTVLIEQRIRKLEQAFGTDKDLGTLAGDESSSLMATVTLLKNQMSLLDKDNLDHIEGRMQTFLPKLNQAMEKKTHSTDSELDKKVTEAYALLKRWEETINTLPAVVDRLVALKAVHEQASSFVQLQQEVEELQQQLAAKVSIMEGNIKLSEESFAQNMNVIKKNMEHLESRVKNHKP